MLKYLSKTFSKVIENIDSIDGLDKIQSEIDLYSIDESLLLIDDDLSFAKYWTEVGKVTEGGLTKYEVYKDLPWLWELSSIVILKSREHFQ